ncbi:hypothetical protein [Micromonospora sp. DT233]|uniref:hypothetical protein n=1 Tax=Micromonospora sp. DT233 TaxID=3393432 RepID=UPI003CF824BF
MTNIATIEDVLENILGLVLGGAAGAYNLPSGSQNAGSAKSGIKEEFRPRNVGGGGRWLIAQTSTLKHTGGWSPEYNKDAVTFYRWRDAIGATKHIRRVTVWVGVVNRDNKQGQEHNTTDPNAVVNASANPVIALGSAWERIRDEIPKVAGVGTSFDPDSLAAVRQVLTALTKRATGISDTLTTQLTNVNAKGPEFRGSAESAWYQRVRGTDRFLSDIDTQNERWDKSLASMEKASRDFIRVLNTAITNWGKFDPPGTWQHPYRVIAAMFNGSTVQYGHTGNNPSGAWDIGSQYSNAASKYEEDESGNVTEPSVLWTPPKWVGFEPFDAFDLNGWNRLDVHLRTKWVERLVSTFKPVVTEAATLVKTFADARNPLHISDPDPLPPPPMPNDSGMPNGFPNLDLSNLFPNDLFSNVFPNDLFSNVFPNDMFSNVFPNDLFSNVFPNDMFSNVFPNNLFPNDPNGGFSKLDPTTLFDPSLANMGGSDPFANGPGGPGGGFSSLGLGDPFANGPGGPGGGFSSLGLGDPFANGPGGPGGGFSSLGLGDPFANGPGGAGSDFGLTDPSKIGGEGAASNLGLSDPFANESTFTPSFGGGGISGLGGLGSSPSSLGDLTPEQLRQLDSAGLLDKIPLSPEEMEFLRQNGLGVPEGTSPTLGQLSPEQLGALQRAGMLDDLPLTAGQRANLGLPGTSGGTTELPSWQNIPVDTSKFPTTIDGVDVSKVPSKSGADMAIGDVSIPGAGAHPSIPGLVVGTGGLSSVPGVSGTPGGLSTAGLSLAPGGAGASGTGTGLSGAPGAAGSAGLAGGAAGMGGMGGGMPFMPPMMGGPGMGGGQQDRDRQRNTWLKEDEEVWGTDPDCAPAVIGRRRKPGKADEDEYPTSGDEWAPTQEERRPYRRR